MKTKSKPKPRAKKNQGQQTHSMPKRVDPALDPVVIFKRGFITRAESEAADLDKIATKINLVDSAGESEGIWAALITPEDDARYINHASKGEIVRAVLLNHALHFFPNPSWGRVVEGKTNGSSRPIFRREDQIERFKATHKAYLAEFPPPKEEGKPL